MSTILADCGPIAIGRRIAAARRASGLTQTGLARRIGLSQAALSLIETGRQPPSVEQLLALAGRLDVPLERLLRGRDRPGDSLIDLAVQLRALGIVDLHVEGAIAPGAFLATEEVIARAVSGREPSPRVVEAMPAVLLWNAWEPRRLHAEAAIRSVEYRVAWLAAIGLAIGRRDGGADDGRFDSMHNYLERVGKPAAEGWDGLGRPATERPKSPIWRRWKICYAADLDVFATRTQTLAQSRGTHRLSAHIMKFVDNINSQLQGDARRAEEVGGGDG